MHNREEEGEGEKDFSASFRVDSPTMIPAAADRSFDLQHDHSASTSSDNDKEEEEFEFSFLGRDSSDAAAGAADEIFANGQIRPVYPLFDRKLLDDHHIHSSSSPPADDSTKHVRLSLRKLFLDERSASFSSSSSSSSSSTSTSSEKDDELEGVPEGTYCVWTPKASAEQQRCKKSGSTGSTTPTSASSSKLRVKIRDLVIGRSRSHGKEKLLFIPKNKGKRTAAGGGDDDGNRKTFLPYKQDLVGLFSSVNAISRTHHPF